MKDTVDQRRAHGRAAQWPPPVKSRGRVVYSSAETESLDVEPNARRNGQDKEPGCVSKNFR